MNFEAMSEQEIIDNLQTFGDQERADALYNVAIRQARDGRYEEARTYSGAARDLFKKLENEYEAARAAYVEAFSLMQEDEFEKAKELFDQAKEVYVLYATDEMKADIHYQLGICSMAMEDIEGAIANYEQAVILYERDGRPALAAAAKMEMGEIRGSQDKQKLALGFFSAALKLYKEADHLVGVSKAHDRIAAALIDLGDAGKAIFHLRESLNLVRFMNLQEKIPYAEKRLAEALTIERHFAEAESLLISSRETYKSREEFALAAKSDTYLADVYDETNRKAEATELLVVCKSIVSAAGDEGGALIIERIFAERMATEDLDWTIQEFEKILQVSKDKKYLWLIPRLEVSLALYYLERSKPGDKALAKALIKKLDQSLVSDEVYVNARFSLAKAKSLFSSRDKSATKFWLNAVLETGKDSRFVPLKKEAQFLLSGLDNVNYPVRSKGKRRIANN